MVGVVRRKWATMIITFSVDEKCVVTVLVTHIDVEVYLLVKMSDECALIIFSSWLSFFLNERHYSALGKH